MAAAGARLESVLASLPEEPGRARVALAAAGGANVLRAEASDFGLAPLLGHLLPEDVPCAQPDVHVALFRHAALERATVQACAQLEDAGVAAIVLKGAPVATLYPAPYLRPSSDVDLLVRPADLRKAQAVLEGGGYALAKDLPDSPAEFSHHLTFARRGTYGIELHFTASEVFQARFEVDRLFERAVWQPLGNGRVRVLADEDQLVQLCTHAAGHWFEGVKWLFDLKLFLAARPVDWAVVITRAREQRVAHAVGLALREARERMGARVPAWVVRALGPHEAIVQLAKRLRAAKPTVTSWSFEWLLADSISVKWLQRLALPVVLRASRVVGLEDRLDALWSRKRGGR